MKKNLDGPFGLAFCIEMANMDSSAKNNEYVNQLLKEQEGLNSQYSHAYKLLQQEIERARTESSDDATRRDAHIVVHSNKQIRVKVKVHIPVEEHPSFNFVGKLLGPKGSSLQQLQEATQTRMAILGRGSMRDKRKEEELRTQGDPKYSHLNEELHVEITAFAPAPEAYRRISGAVAEIQRFLVPDFFDAPPQYDGKSKPPFPGEAPPPPHMGPRGGPPLPPRPMGPPMMQGRGGPPRRGAMVQSTYNVAPEGDEWAPPGPSPRRGGFGGAAPPPAARPARPPYEEPVNDYNNYGDGYGEYNSGNAGSYYDYAADTDGNFTDGYQENARGPMRSGGAGAPRGRANSRMGTHPYAGATRRGY